MAQALGAPLSELFKVEANTAPLSAKTVLEHHRLISTILAQAEKEMLVPYNAAEKATTAKVARQSRTIFSLPKSGRFWTRSTQSRSNGAP